MNPQFHPGQEVVCTKKDNWTTVYGPETVRNGPEYNQVVTISEIRKTPDWEFLVFVEFGPRWGYSSRHFSPVLSREDLVVALDEICEVVLV